MRVYCSDFFARAIGKWVEFQPGPVLFDDRNGRPRSALKAFSAVEPCAKRRERPRHRATHVQPRLFLDDPRVLVADIGVEKHGWPQAQSVEQLNHPPDADAHAIISPAEIDRVWIPPRLSLV